MELDDSGTGCATNLEPDAAIPQLHLQAIGAHQCELRLDRGRGQPGAGGLMDLGVVHAPAVVLDLASDTAAKALEHE